MRTRLFLLIVLAAARPANAHFREQALSHPLLFFSGVLTPTRPASTIDRALAVAQVQERRLQILTSRALQGMLVLSLTSMAAAQSAAPGGTLPVQSTELSGYVTYFLGGDRNWPAVDRFGRQITHFDVFGVSADDKGNLVAHQDFVAGALARLRRAAPQADLSVVVTNDRPRHDKDPALLHRWINTASARQKHIQALLGIAQSADGLTVDYENLPQGRWTVLKNKIKKFLRRPGVNDDAEAYALLTHELSLALHAEHKKLILVLEDKTLSAPHALDWPSLNRDADLISFMGYQYHGPGTVPGAISPPNEVLALARKAHDVAGIPMSELRLDLPLFGFDWPEGDRKHRAAVVGSLDGLANLLATYKAPLKRDPETQSARVTYSRDVPLYKGKGKKRRLDRMREERHSVWVEDAVSVYDKIQKLRTRLGVTHVSVWQLGTGGDLTALFGLPQTSMDHQAVPSANQLHVRGAA